MDEQPDLEDVTAELYGLDPDQFTATRNTRAQEARAGGDRALAEQIRQLHKPSTSAWVLNLVSRHHPETIAEVLDLGAAMRQAQHQLDGDRLRELGRERRRVTRDLTSQAQALAADAGRDLGASIRTQIDQSVRAAMSDPDAGTALAAGRLSEPLSASGWPAGGATDAASRLAAPPPPRARAVADKAERPERKRPAKKQPDDKREQRERAERERAEREHAEAVRKAQAEAKKAQSAARAAQTDLNKTQTKVDRLTERRRGLEESAEDLRRRLEALEHQIDTVDGELRTAETGRNDAAEHEQELREAAEQARRTVDDLEGRSVLP